MASWNRGNDDPSKAPANAAEKEIISNEFDEATGIRTIQYITINKAGKTVQVQEKTKETKRMVKSNKNVNERKKWAKFGDCQGMPKGPEKNITYLSAEKLSFDLKLGRSRDDGSSNDITAKLAASGKSSILVCRNCGESGHWTLKCPQRNSIVPKGMDDESAATNSRAERLGINKDGDAKAPSTGGRYVPKFRQDGGGERFKSGYDRSDRDQEHVLKVQNLTQEAVEDDIRDLFSNFARPSYIKLVRDRNTQESRGLAFVKFTRKSDAQLCLDNLNGHPYGNQILMVEWSQQWQPRVSTTASILKSQKRRF